MILYGDENPVPVWLRERRLVSPGTVLREFGMTCICPTVPLPLGAWAWATRLTAATMDEAAKSASRRGGSTDAGTMATPRPWPMNS